MEKARRKDLVREYRERPVAAGIVALSCSASGEAWVGSTKNLSAAKASLIFQLRSGLYAIPAVQAAWQTYGEDAFTFEQLEAVDPDNPELIGLLLKERAAHWRERKSAGKLYG